MQFIDNQNVYNNKKDSFESFKQRDEKLISEGFHYDPNKDLYICAGTSTVVSSNYIGTAKDNKFAEVISSNPKEKPRLFFNETPPKETQNFIENRYLGITIKHYEPDSYEKKQKEILEKISKEYDEYYPQFEKLLDYYKAEFGYLLKEFHLKRKQYEKIEFEHRIKDKHKCIRKLKKEGDYFKDDATLFKLKDLIGFRILVFPNIYLNKIKEKIETQYPNSKRDFNQDKKIYKYFINIDHADFKLSVIELQLIPYLLGKYWDIEHDLLYKPEGFNPSEATRKKLEEINNKIEPAILVASEEFSKILESDT